jgi:hypothetical protein
MKVENDEMYGDWAHWIEAPCPSCRRTLRVHHLHDFVALVCPGCRSNPLLYFCGVPSTRRHPDDLAALLMKEGVLSEVAADVARELKADAGLPHFVEFLISLHYVKTEALEMLLRRRAPAAWIEGARMTFEPQGPVAATGAPQDGARVHLDDWPAGPDLVKRVPRTIARVYRCVPVWGDGAVLVLAVDDPGKVRREDLAGLLQCDVRLVRAPREQVKAAIARHYGSSGWQDALWSG